MDASASLVDSTPHSPSAWNDPIVGDTRLALRLSTVTLGVLLLCSALGLCSWPGQWIADAMREGTATQVMTLVNSVVVLLSVLFWGSRPPRIQVLVALVAGVLVTVLLAAVFRPVFNPLDPLHLVMSMGLPCAALLLWRVAQSYRGPSIGLIDARLRPTLVVMLVSLLIASPALELSAALHPQTFDVYALAADHALGLAAPLSAFSHWVQTTASVKQLLWLAYLGTPLILLSSVGMQLNGRPAHLPSMTLVWIAMTLLAWLAYHVFPIAGPQFLFTEPYFAEAIGKTWPLDLPVVENFPRNGMPSMHFGWVLATALVVWRTTRHWLPRLLSLIGAVGVAMATIGLGQHYLIDLIVAVPFVLASMALCSTGVPWSEPAKRHVVIAGFAAWLAWVLLLRFAMPSIQARAWAAPVMVLATVAVVACQWRWQRRFAAVAATLSSADLASEPAAEVTRYWLRRFGLMFVASGAAALVYQVVFAKKLALVFGSTATATFTVLATFLGGMSIGALIGGIWASRSRRPLRDYAMVEIGIAIYCVASPLLFDLAQSLYAYIGAGMPPDASSLLVLRVVLGGAVLVVPTALMGATLPLLAQALGDQAGSLGRRVGWLYFCNTMGAALGALLTAYFVIPAVGIQRTVLFAALLNLLVGLGALELLKRPDAQRLGDGRGDDAAVSPGAWPHGRWVARLAVVALGVGGLLSLGLEVSYVHLLSIVAGNSVYAFGLMLAAFLVGLSAGGEGARRLLGVLAPTTGLAAVLLGLAATVALTADAWNAIPPYFASFAQYPVGRTFASREAIRGVVCALVMIPPTLFIGAAYVFAMEIATAGRGVRRLGWAAAVNTLGNIAGVLLFGFVVLPRIGGLGASLLIGAGAATLGLVILVLAVRGAARGAVAVVAVLAIGLLWQQRAATLDYDVMANGSNVYFAAQDWGRTIAHAESIDGGLTTVSLSPDPARTVKTLLTNGKFQGSSAPHGEMQAQIGFAIAPLLHQERRGRALVIGYGTGVTSRVLHEAGFAHLDIADLSADIVRLADEHFSDVNRRVSHSPGVALHITDGRNQLLLEREPYDLISIEVTSIWFAGAASLYNREFYELARSRLREDGVLQQWVQLHRLTPRDILSVVTTLRGSFRYVSFYVLGGQGVLVATNDPRRAHPRTDAVAAIEHSETLADVRALSSRPVGEVAVDRLLDPDGVNRYIAGFGPDPLLWLSTDDNVALEYSTPKANVNDAQASVALNMATLSRFRAATDPSPAGAGAGVPATRSSSSVP